MTDSERVICWANYAYTQPLADALTAMFAVPFSAQDLGGSRVYVTHDGLLEGGVYLIVGAGFAGYEDPHGRPDGGYSVGVHDSDQYSCQGVADDHTATTAESVVELAKKALALASDYDASDDTFTVWTRNVDGSETQGRYRN